MDYWDRKEELSRKAKRHNLEMEDLYQEEIDDCISSSKIYREDFKGEKVRVRSSQIVEFQNLDTVASIFKKPYPGKVAILNFASYKHPGGMYLNGSKAQEECLCHASFLYNVLSAFEDSYYEPNRRSVNRALYNNRAIYSENVRFFNEGKSKRVSVITCAAPNWSAAKKWGNVSEEENYRELRSRINFVLNIAEKEMVDTLIVGAFGSGVFGQNPEDVCKLFLAGISKYNRFKMVVFAVPGVDKNAKVFKKGVGEFNASKS